MMVVVAYDVSTKDPAGVKRLAKVAKLCKRYGRRVQNSVFECSVDSLQLKQLQTALLKIVDSEQDSLRFYNLGNRYQSRISHFGAKQVKDVNDPMIF